ncbi:MAG TPA: LuxR C-terminal-related transcriptional regulator [Actinospica sp.]|nr:LuxR C-terminal-related transcriptional regulator [Actinospica sp.]
MTSFGPSAAAAGRVGTQPGAGGVVARLGLFDRLNAAARVTMVSAPAGSGKTILLRSWIEEAGLGDRTAWVAAGPDGRDPHRFWVSAVDALRTTAPGSALVQPVSAAPDLNGWALVERLLRDLAPLCDPLWLVLDDVHDLGEEALKQVQLLVLRAPQDLRFVLASRHDVRLGLHRLRLTGGVTEIRGADLRFSPAEAAELFAAAGVRLPGSALAVLHERTEGWAAGLRLAALSLAGHPDPERFAAEFSGSERTVAEYLLAEVLERQSEEVRRLLMRTSILERVNGELADLLTGGSGGERMLQDLEEVGAFVVALDANRTWFRYHRMFAGLLALELRRTSPGEVAAVHRTAAGWFAAHGFPVEAIGHAQAAQDLDMAAQLLVGHWPRLYLDGRDAVSHELITGFPVQTRAADAELAALSAADELSQGAPGAAEGYLDLAERAMAAVPAARHGQARLLLGIVRLLTARQRGDLAAETREARRLQATAEATEATRPAFGEELRALALISLGYANGWRAGHEQTQHLDQGIALARRIGRPYLEFTGLAYRSAIEASWSLPGALEHSCQAIDLAEQHGWADKAAVGVACVARAGTLTWQGRLDEAEEWLRRAGRTVTPEVEAVAALAAQYIRGQIDLARGRPADAVAAFRAAERLAQDLAAPHPFARPVRAWLVHALVRLGETRSAEAALAGLGEQERASGGIRIAAAILRLAQHDPRAALAELGPVLDGSARLGWRIWPIEADLLEAIAREELGESEAADRALERALERAESSGALLWFLLHPVRELLERRTARPAARASTMQEIQRLMAGQDLTAENGAGAQQSTEALSASEVRILRYLPTNLTAPEIADELSVSRNTVKTHMRSMYAKLDTHSRSETVARARELGLLAPSGAARRS